MIKHLFIIWIGLWGFSYRTCGQAPSILPLWGAHMPNYQVSEEQEERTFNGILRIAKVQEPTLEVFRPSNGSGSNAAVIICPGGGYRILAYEWEGTDIAKWFNSKGMTAFVLKYRLPDAASVVNSYEAPLQDVQRAIRLVRSRAEEWGIDPNKIGIMGFSAGGHLASTAGTHFNDPNTFVGDEIDALSARPDFMILGYPVISMREEITHQGSKLSLLGNDPSEEMIQRFSNEKRVSEYTPPTFLVHSGDDGAVPVANSLLFYEALIAHRVPAEMHLYPFGGHGYALAWNKAQLEQWPELLWAWLREIIQ
jgi:acetyl esterase/lipase